MQRVDVHLLETGSAGPVLNIGFGEQPFVVEFAENRVALICAAPDRVVVNQRFEQMKRFWRDGIAPPFVAAADNLLIGNPQHCVAVLEWLEENRMAAGLEGFGGGPKGKRGVHQMMKNGSADHQIEAAFTVKGPVHGIEAYWRHAVPVAGMAIDMAQEDGEQLLADVGGDNARLRQELEAGQHRVARTGTEIQDRGVGLGEANSAQRGL